MAPKQTQTTSTAPAGRKLRLPSIMPMQIIIGILVLISFGALADSSQLGAALRALSTGQISETEWAAHAG